MHTLHPIHDALTMVHMSAQTGDGDIIRSCSIMGTGQHFIEAVQRANRNELVRHRKQIGVLTKRFQAYGARGGFRSVVTKNVSLRLRMIPQRTPTGRRLSNLFGRGCLDGMIWNCMSDMLLTRKTPRCI